MGEDEASIEGGNSKSNDDNGSSVAETETNEPKLESDPEMISRRSWWYDRGREWGMGLGPGSRSMCSRVGDARGVAGEKSVENLSMSRLSFAMPRGGHGGSGNEVIGEVMLTWEFSAKFLGSKLQVECVECDSFNGQFSEPTYLLLHFPGPSTVVTSGLSESDHTCQQD